MQLSFFGADEQAPSVGDLTGLLAGPAQVVHAPGGVRLSVVVAASAPGASAAAGWRVAGLTRAFADRGLPSDLSATVDGQPCVRTAFTPELTGLAAAWTRGAVKVPPADLRLDGPRLRLWAVAAGRSDEHGYLLGLGETDPDGFGGAALDPWRAVATALAAAGVPAVPLGRRGGGPAYRIGGARRLRRLRELVGDPPDPAADWPVEP